MGEPAKFTSVLAISSDDGRTLRLSWDEIHNMGRGRKCSETDSVHMASSPKPLS